MFVPRSPVGTSVVDPDPDSLGSMDPDPGGQKLPSIIEKLINFIQFLKCLMFA
jgi:hypothetical protein